MTKFKKGTSDKKNRLHFLKNEVSPFTRRSEGVTEYNEC